MPLIVLSGIPCSGKTTRSLELQKYFEEKFEGTGQKVEIISECDMMCKAGDDRNTFYADSKKENTVRCSIKSDIQRKLDTRDLLIFDGSNYIKGYRYEIYCMTKLYKTPQCTLHCDLPAEHAWLWNKERAESEQYNREIFDELIRRYEVPNNLNRWDAPLFSVTPDDILMTDDIYMALYKVAEPKPNQSTQCPPLASTNYLYELDRITQEITNAILSAKKLGINYDIKIPGSDLVVKNSSTMPQLMKLRRQFLTYSKMQQSEIDQIAVLYIEYLNKNL